MNTASAVRADRARRGNLSRKVYADLVGLTPTKISNIEGGRKLKSGECDKLDPFIGDLMQLPDDAPAPEVERTDEWSTKRRQLQRDYDTIIDALQGKPAPIPWPLNGTAIADAKPSDFERVQRWIDEMFDYRLPGPDDPAPEPPVETELVYDPNDRPDDATDEQTATQRVDPAEDWDDVVHFTTIDDVTLYSWGPSVNTVNPATRPEGGPGPSPIAPLPDDFQVRHER